MRTILVIEQLLNGIVLGSMYALVASGLSLIWGSLKMLNFAHGEFYMLGGYAGGQAEYARVPFADVGPIKIENGLTDEQVLFLSDILPTGYMAAENCNISRGDTIAVFGCGPVGQFAIKSALMFGAEKVLAIASESDGSLHHAVCWARGKDDASDTPWWTAGGPLMLGSRDRERAQQIKQLEVERDTVEQRRNRGLLVVPNVPHSSVPVGKSAADNFEARRVGTPRGCACARPARARR